MLRGPQSQLYTSGTVLLNELEELKKKRILGENRHLDLCVSLARSLYHFREHLPNKIDRAEVENRCPAYRLIADVCTASKHGVVTQKTPQGDSLIRSYSDVFECIASVGFEDADGSYCDNQVLVLSQCSDGLERCLDYALYEVHNFWVRHLKSIRLGDALTEWPLPTPIGQAAVPRSIANMQIDMGSTVGFGLQVCLRTYDFNYDAARAVNGDVSTGTMIIHRSPFPLALTATTRCGQIAAEIQILLSDDEARRYLAHRMRGDGNLILDEIFASRSEEIERLVMAEAARQP